MVKCPHCTSRWESPFNNIDTCPFCQKSLLPTKTYPPDSPEAMVCDIVSQQGAELYLNPHRFSAILLDVFTKDKRTLTILQKVLGHNGGATLYNNRNQNDLDYTGTARLLMRKVADNELIDISLAEIGVILLAVGLGRDVPECYGNPSSPTPSPKPAPKPKVSPKASPMTEFVIEDSTLVEYIGKGEDVVIPNSVTEIGKDAFYQCYFITSVVIPDSVTEIGSCAFLDCQSLTSIVIPDSVTKIGKDAFESCSSLTSVVIPDSVTNIGRDTFYQCESLTSVVIPDSVTEIGYFAFGECNLTSVVIPNSVTRICEHAFRECKSLSSIVIPDSVTKIGDYAFSECYALTFVDIPDSVTEIGNGTFLQCDSLTSVTLGSGSYAEGYMKANYPEITLNYN